MTDGKHPDIHQILKKHWGFDSFRPLQEDIIMSVLEGRDTLGLMPTGGGKSITFQVPSLCFDSGITIVVTPLVSLMKDQVDNLKRHRIKAAYLHYGMTTKENRIAWEKIVNGNARFLYISPERLQNPRFLMELRNLKINLITVDEAHCISQWGYDFRPSYLNIKKLRDIKPDVPVLALTATATPEVTQDIMKQLRFKQPNLFAKSFTRDNISYLVRKSETKIMDVLHILSRTSGTSIVYTRSRKRTKEVAEYLTNNGISATFYHAGLDTQTKTERQNDWISGKVRVMVATNAFGMGIDKSDVRVVIHYDVPPSLEEYYQEAGRAGRDGQNSFAVLLANAKADKALLHKRVTEAFPERDYVKETYGEICTHLHVSIGEGYELIKEFDIEKFCRLFGKDEKQCRAALRLLSQAGYMHFIEMPEKKSRIKLMCEREELYDIKFNNGITEKVLSTLMRLYPGLFTDFVYITETEIAYQLKLSQNEVYEALLQLDRMNIACYVPRSGLPLIYLPTAREEKISLRIGRDIYEGRRKQLENRIEAIIDYTFKDNSCRVKRMLTYFGEQNACNCGKCDWCREISSKKRKKSNIDITERIVNYIKSHPEGVRFSAIEADCKSETSKVTQSLSFLCTEGFVELRDTLYFIGS